MCNRLLPQITSPSVIFLWSLITFLFLRYVDFQCDLQKFKVVKVLHLPIYSVAYILNTRTKLNYVMFCTSGPPYPPPLYTQTHTLTRITPASNMTVAGLFEHSLFPHGQTGGKNMTAEWHTLSRHLAHGPRWQTNQGQVVIVVMGVVAWVEDNLIDAVLFFIFLRDEGVVVAHSNFILLGAVSVPGERNRGMD